MLWKMEKHSCWTNIDDFTAGKKMFILLFLHIFPHLEKNCWHEYGLDNLTGQITVRVEMYRTSKAKKSQSEKSHGQKHTHLETCGQANKSYDSR